MELEDLQIIDRITSRRDVPDQAFRVSDDPYADFEMCEHTGFEVRFHGESSYWFEFIDRKGNKHYGR